VKCVAYAQSDHESALQAVSSAESSVETSFFTRSDKVDEMMVLDIIFSEPAVSSGLSEKGESGTSTLHDMSFSDLNEVQLPQFALEINDSVGNQTSPAGLTTSLSQYNFIDSSIVVAEPLERIDGGLYSRSNSLKRSLSESVTPETTLTFDALLFGSLLLQVIIHACIYVVVVATVILSAFVSR
jgi:hypothetical protein